MDAEKKIIEKLELEKEGKKKKDIRKDNQRVFVMKKTPTPPPKKKKEKMEKTFQNQLRRWVQIILRRGKKNTSYILSEKEYEKTKKMNRF